tara:strand:+ start:2078 stop:2479 length:402 start_codon:yes stop_codon:yes gene_type:complete
MIEKIKQIFETQTSILKKKAGIFKEEDIECAIDKEVVDCKEIDKEPYVGVPAPLLTPHDDWFEDPPKSEMQIEFEAFKQEAHKFYQTKESENIHQQMYEIATKTSATTLKLDPIGGSENLQGNSENVNQSNSF